MYLTITYQFYYYYTKGLLYEPGNRAYPVGGVNFVFCSYGKFNPGYQDEKSPKGLKKYPWNRVPTCRELYKPCAVENVSSGTVPVSGWIVHMEKSFSSVSEILVAKTEISVTGPDCLLI